MTGNPATRWLAQALRQALRNLYDPVELRRGALASALGMSNADDSFGLQQILLDAVAALQPNTGLSPQSDAWRTYQILYHRYVDQFSQTEVASNIGVSERQLRRLEHLALETLAEYLRSRYQVNMPSLTGQAPPDLPEDEEAVHDAPSPSPPRLLAQEARVLEQFLPSEPVRVPDAIDAALETLAPLMSAQRVKVDRMEFDQPLIAAAHPTTFRQALLIVLATASRYAARALTPTAENGTGTITIDARTISADVCVDICTHSPGPMPPFENDRNDLQMARELLALSGGRLEVQSTCRGELGYAVRVCLPGVERKAVLAVDDNADALQLIGRYLVGTAYPFAGLRDPLQAIDLAERLQPVLILLDVMLPGIDGWELLARLREHPRTRHIPVAVCTVLPQEQLALSLGAAAFLRKPVTREELLALLDGVTRRGS